MANTQDLRNKAYILGYSIYYPGSYCDKAVIYPCWHWAGDRATYNIDTSDSFTALQLISDCLDDIAAARTHLTQREPDASPQDESKSDE